MHFIDQCQQTVLVDCHIGSWSLPKDGHGLVNFDGSHLYEHVLIRAWANS